MAEEGKGILNGSRNAVVAAVLSAILGSTGGPFLVVKLGVNPYRADAYTSTQATQHMVEDERRFNALERHVYDDEIAMRQSSTRIATLEAQNELILIQLNRILTRLDDR